MTNDKLITSLQNPVVKMLRSLSAKKYRDENGIFIVEGARHINDALDRGWQLELAAYSPRALQDAAVIKVLEVTRHDKKHALEVTDDILGSITNRDNNQPLIATFRQQMVHLSTAREGLWIGLENIRDPGNLGTILRTADAVSANGIILIGNTCDPWSLEVIRASMGSFARVPLAAASALDFIEWRKSFKGKVIGTHLHARAVDYRAAPRDLPLVLVMGNETAGLSPEISAACDTLVKIPMTGGAESLNLAISTGIMLYEIRRATLPQ